MGVGIPVSGTDVCSAGVASQPPHSAARTPSTDVSKYRARALSRDFRTMRATRSEAEAMEPKTLRFDSDSSIRSLHGTTHQDRRLCSQIWLEPHDSRSRVQDLVATAAEVGFGQLRTFLMWHGYSRTAVLVSEESQLVRLAIAESARNDVARAKATEAQGGALLAVSLNRLGIPAALAPISGLNGPQLRDAAPTNVGYGGFRPGPPDSSTTPLVLILPPGAYRHIFLGREFRIGSSALVSIVSAQGMAMLVRPDDRQ